MLLREIGVEQRWKPRADWVAREAIVSFAGHALVFRGEILGVLGVSSRTTIEDEAFEWIRLFANHAAVSICPRARRCSRAATRERLSLSGNPARV